MHLYFLKYFQPEVPGIVFQTVPIGGGGMPMPGGPPAQVSSSLIVNISRMFIG